MKYVSTRKGIEATAPETVFQGLAPDGGLYVPVVGASLRDARGRLGEASLPTPSATVDDIHIITVARF